MRCDTEDILPAHWLVSPQSPLCPLWDVTEAKHKAVFHGAGAYLASESMWDMLGNKGASLHPLAGVSISLSQATHLPGLTYLTGSWWFSVEKVCTWKETDQHGTWTTATGGEAETRLSISLQHIGSLMKVICIYLKLQILLILSSPMCFEEFQIPVSNLL